MPTKKNTGKIYSIILNWNNYRDTSDCIRSILASSLLPDKIIIIDNDSRDGSLAKLKNSYVKYPNIQFIRNPRNVGFAAGINIGIRMALKDQAEFVFLLNNDAVVERDCIHELKYEILKNPRNGIAGPRIFYFNEPNRIWHGGGQFNSALTGVVIKEKNKEEKNTGTAVGDITFLTACAMLIRTIVFEQIGLFDEEYFFYDEDLDFCIRAQRSKFKLNYIPSAKAWHKIGPINQNRTSPFVLFHIARSKIMFLRKNFKFLYCLYGYLIQFLLYTPFRIYQIEGGNGSWRSIFSWFYGTWMGISEPIQINSGVELGKQYRN